MTALGAHLETGVTTVCRAWILARADGHVLGFTDHDRDVVVADVTCSAATGLDASAIDAATGLAIDNGEVSGSLTAAGLTAADLRAGRWDGASVTAYRLNWEAPEEVGVTFRGTLGRIVERDGSFSAELRGLSAALNVRRGRVFQAGCDAAFGDARCGIDASSGGLTAEAEIASVRAGGLVIGFSASALAAAAHGFANGSCVWLDGEARGLRARIRSDAVEGGMRALALTASVRAPVAPGDRVRLTVGCDKTIATCAHRFANAVNFRGFPDLPGEEWHLAMPRPDFGG